MRSKTAQHLCFALLTFLGLNAFSQPRVSTGVVYAPTSDLAKAKQKFDLCATEGISQISLMLGPGDVEASKKSYWRKFFALAKKSGLRFKILLKTTEMDDAWFDEHGTSASINTLEYRRNPYISVWSPEVQRILTANADKVVAFLTDIEATSCIDLIDVDLGPNRIEKIENATVDDFWFYESGAHKSFADFAHRKYLDVRHLNKAWHENFKQWNEIKIPSPRTKSGQEWDDVLTWYRTSKRKFAKFQIENYRTALKRAGCGETIKLLLPTVTDSVSAAQWKKAVNSGLGDTAVANMDDCNFLYEVASANKCGMDLIVSENQLRPADAEVLAAKMRTVPTFVQGESANLSKLPNDVRKQFTGIFVDGPNDKSDKGALKAAFDFVSTRDDAPSTDKKVIKTDSTQDTSEASIVGASRLDDRWWQERHLGIIDKLAHDNFLLMFAGDSITQNWEQQSEKKYRNTATVWQKFYSKRNVLNLGFSADSTDNLKWRFDNGELGDPTKKIVVLNIGINDIFFYKKTEKQIEDNIEYLVGEVRENCPGSQVVLVGILPTQISNAVSKATANVNNFLRSRYSRSADVQFVDASAAFLKDNEVVPECYIEHYEPIESSEVKLLHPTSEAMFQIAQILEPYLAKAAAKL